MLVVRVGLGGWLLGCGVIFVVVGVVCGGMLIGCLLLGFRWVLGRVCWVGVVGVLRLGLLLGLLVRGCLSLLWAVLGVGMTRLGLVMLRVAVAGLAPASLRGLRWLLLLRVFRVGWSLGGSVSRAGRRRVGLGGVWLNRSGLVCYSRLT